MSSFLRGASMLLFASLWLTGAKGHSFLRNPGQPINEYSMIEPIQDEEESAASGQRRLIASTDGYDLGGPAPICWYRDSNNIAIQMPTCPAGLTLEFLTTLPQSLYSDAHYPTKYRFTLDKVAVAHKVHNRNDIPHANIHSCLSNIGFCTPMIPSSISTQTPALVRNLTAPASGSTYSVEYESDVALDPGKYTIIAHVFFYVNVSNVAVRYDMATAVFREVLPPKQIITASAGIAKGMTAIIGMACTFLFVILCFLVYYRKHKVMRFSQVKILMGMTVSGMVALAGVPLYTVNTNVSCLLRPWITILPLNFMFGLLFGKTWRIWKLMNNKQLKAMKIKEGFVVVVAAALVMPEVFIHGIYFLISAPQNILVPTVNEFTFVNVCKGGNHVGIFDALHITYGALILVMGCYVANKSASLTTLFNEAKYILFAIYTCSLMALILVPASYVVKGDPSTSYILRAMGVSFSVCGVIGAINIPKIRLIMSGVEISTTDDTKKTTAVAAASPNGGRPTSPNASLGPIPVKDHIPSEVYGRMETALPALKKVMDRQVEGFAVVFADFEDCVKEVNALNGLLQRCSKAGAGGAGPATVNPMANTAKVVPTA